WYQHRQASRAWADGTRRPNDLEVRHPRSGPDSRINNPFLFPSESSFRTVERLGCRVPKPSLSSIGELIFLSCQAEKIFAKLSETKAPNPGEGGFSRQLLSLVQTCNRRINPSEKKDCFMKTKTSRTTNSMKRSSHHRGRVAALLIALVLACFALSQQARAVCQDGCLTNQNTVLGDDALFSNTGSYNTAIGFNALHSNTSGISNTATGYRALLNNTTGSVNKATGIFALVNNTTGEKNTANGVSALFSNTSGNRNTAIGWGALQNNTTGTLNVAVGK